MLSRNASNPYIYDKVIFQIASMKHIVSFSYITSNITYNGCDIEQEHLYVDFAKHIT